jgi:hypothetical protein
MGGRSVGGVAVTDLGADPLAAVLGVLRQAGQACTVSGIKTALVRAGATRPEVDAVWPRVQKRLRHHPYVFVDGDRTQLTYRFVATAPSPAAALDRLVAGDLPADVRAAHLDLVRDGLRRSALDPEEAGRRRQAAIDALRALAELAIEVEELVANGASGSAIVQRVRGRVKRSGLEPVERAGLETTYDRTRHKPIGGSIPDGASVIVVRPGYVWKSSDGDVPISRPVVER